MDSEEVLRTHLIRLLGWRDAHPSVDQAIADLPPALRGMQSAELPWSPWQLLEHLRLCQRDILEFCVNPAYVEPRFPDDFWPETPAPPSEQAWDECVAGFITDRERLARLIADPETNLYRPIPHGQGQTLLREILLVADHNAYHTGQLIAVRRALGAWG